MKIALVPLACIALAMTACATSKPIQGPNGTTAFFIKCGSAAIDKCYEEAAKVCPKGYTVLANQDNPNGVAVPAGGMLFMSRGPSSMFVECKA